MVLRSSSRKSRVIVLFSNFSCATGAEGSRRGWLSSLATPCKERRSTLWLRTLLLLALTWPALASAQAFRCGDSTSVLYTDQPCADGALIVPERTAEQERMDEQRALEAHQRQLRRQASVRQLQQERLQRERERLEREQAAQPAATADEDDVMIVRQGPPLWGAWHRVPHPSHHWRRHHRHELQGEPAQTPSRLWPPTQRHLQPPIQNHRRPPAGRRH